MIKLSCNGNVILRHIVVYYILHLHEDETVCPGQGRRKGPTCRCLSAPPYRHKDDTPYSFFMGRAAAVICCASSLQNAVHFSIAQGRSLQPWVLGQADNTLP